MGYGILNINLPCIASTLNSVKITPKECVEDPVANGLSLMNQILYIRQLAVRASAMVYIIYE